MECPNTHGPECFLTGQRPSEYPSLPKVKVLGSPDAVLLCILRGYGVLLCTLLLSGSARLACDQTT